MTYRDGAAVRYDYNARGLLAAILSEPDGRLIARLSYEASGKVQSLTHGNGVATRHRYDDRTRLTRLTTTDPQKLPQVDFDYTYDGASNVSRIADVRPMAIVPDGDPRRNSQVFDYDDSNRLTSVRYALGNAGRNDGSITYRYDRIGNMLAQQAAGCVGGLNLGNLSYGPRSDRAGRHDQAPGPHARIASETGRKLSYDARGNDVQLQDDAYTWDAWNHQVGLSRAGVQARYVYDHQGRRAAKTVASGGSRSQGGRGGPTRLRFQS
ncbi:MAG: hypothetical protein JWN86_2495 [Planctomycetota bacterium]|nr:hypothetical protein [Planctomycetota bacterium]